MIVSGMPIRNGLRHAKEMASISLELRKCVNAFKIEHLPEESLKLRIGLHSGEGFTIMAKSYFHQWLKRSSQVKNGH